MNFSQRLLRLANLSLDRGQPLLFKRLASLSSRIARSDRTNTDLLLHKGLEEQDADDIKEDDDPGEIESLDEEGSDEDVEEEESDDEDVEAFSPFPSALPQKERKQGPHPKDVSVARPDWWNPR